MAVVLPFAGLALALLWWAGPTVVPADTGTVGRAGEQPVLLVSPRAHLPAFTALVEWNREQGCRAYVVTVPDHDLLDPASPELTYLAGLCALRGVRFLVLGGSSNTGEVMLADPLVRLQLEPVNGSDHFPDGFRLGRVPVRSPEEAWLFVEACRAQGMTLDHLLHPETPSTFFAQVGMPVGSEPPTQAPRR